MKKSSLSQYVTKTGAAEIAKCVEGSIRAAVARGELQEHTTGDGRVRLLLISDVEAWSKVERRTGPKTS